MDTYNDESIDDIYDEIKKSMKQIIEETNTVLKHSHSAFKKTKEKMINLEKIPMEPKLSMHSWLKKRDLQNITIPEFFECLFKEASFKNMLNHQAKTISFNEEDAIIFGFAPNVPISIYEVFENLPKYFN